MKALRDVFGDTLVDLANTNSKIVVLDADLANSTKADKFALAHPDRFLEMGIAEQNFVETGRRAKRPRLQDESHQEQRDVDPNEICSLPVRSASSGV